jgi:hypothetical protein
MTAPPGARDEIPVIDPRAVYSIAQAQSALQLRKNCLPREIRLGRLRVAKRAGRHFVFGRWLLEWLAAGEVRRPQRPAATETATAKSQPGD